MGGQLKKITFEKKSDDILAVIIWHIHFDFAGCLWYGRVVCDGNVVKVGHPQNSQKKQRLFTAQIQQAHL